MKRRRHTLPAFYLPKDGGRVSVAAEQTPKGVVRVLAALSDVNRYRIMTLLARAERDIACGGIATTLGLSPSLVSHHLGVLESARLIERRKDGLLTLNRLDRHTVSSVLAAMHELVEPSTEEAGIA
jgi:DNA-binding transcriptional ArsR family regulator